MCRDYVGDKLIISSVIIEIRGWVVDDGYGGYGFGLLRKG